MKSPPIQPAKAFLVSRGISQTEAAMALGVHRVWLCRVLNGLEEPSERVRQGMAEYLGVPAEALFFDRKPVGDLLMAGSR